MTLRRFISDIYKERSIVWELAKKDISLRYLGSSLGIFWAFANPILLILIYWFVFQVGFRSYPVGDVPFVLWLLAGITPWFFFSESLSSSTYSIEQNSYLVKKIVFKTQLLPIVKVISALQIHLLFVMLTLIVFTIYGVGVDFYLFQLLYYITALVLLSIGLGWITSALNVFLKDIGQIVSIILQFGFWLTPIFWSFSMVPDKFEFLFKLNPLFYIVEGFRDTFINKVWFWEHYNMTIYYWFVTIILLLVGSALFKKLSSHFSDVI
ncbi:ABC transporter permease [Paenibacillus lautus]|uniref:Transport permease protein n=1 Tax=Paenibacillus lautus TaxID=1401 RepID=A0A385TBK2_PAELA|nr:ABC transporter permease [Paenibacillus lautus]AYB41920.1 ABC transporter permease [Paenibacillus lautus]